MRLGKFCGLTAITTATIALAPLANADVDTDDEREPALTGRRHADG